MITACQEEGDSWHLKQARMTTSGWDFRKHQRVKRRHLPSNLPDFSRMVHPCYPGLLSLTSPFPHQRSRLSSVNLLLYVSSCYVDLILRKFLKIGHLIPIEYGTRNGTFSLRNLSHRHLQSPMSNGRKESLQTRLAILSYRGLF